MRRRLAPIEPSETIFTGPMSPRARTWVPPHSSIECRPGLEHAHDVAVLVAEERDGAELARPPPWWSRSVRTGSLARISALARSSISRICVGVSRLGVAEVEAQPVGRRRASPAASRARRAPCAAPSAGRGCRCGCGGWRRGARRRWRRGLLARLDAALVDDRPWRWRPGQPVGGVDHLGAAGVGA